MDEEVVAQILLIAKQKAREGRDFRPRRQAKEFFERKLWRRNGSEGS
jgi:hypothetical protein